MTRDIAKDETEGQQINRSALADDKAI